MSEKVSLSGNEQLKTAWRQQPTDRNLPPFQLLHTGSGSSDEESKTQKDMQASLNKLNQLAEKYERLTRIEKDLDWNLTRGIVDMKDKSSDLYVPGIRSKVRVYVKVEPLNQSWQEGSVNPAMEPLDYTKRTNFPGANVEISAKLISPESVFPNDLVLSDLFSRVVVETDQNVDLYSGPTLLDWRNPKSYEKEQNPLAPEDKSAPKIAGLRVQIKGTENTNLRVLLFRNAEPEIVQVHPKLGKIIDIEEGDRVYITRALWTYIKTHGLQDLEKRQIRADPTLQTIFNQQGTVPFHHVPEYIKKYLLPAKPLVLDTIADVSKPTSINAFDVFIELPDPAVEKISSGLQNLTNYQQGQAAIAEIDQHIANTVADIRATLVQCSFLTSFASDPQSFVRHWVDSQARDLSLILSGNASQEQVVGGGPTALEDLRRQDVWYGDWVDPATKLFTNTATR